MAFFAEKTSNTQFTIFFWVTLLIIATIAFLYVMVSSHHFFYHRDIFIVINDEKRYTKKISYTIGQQVIIDKLKFIKGKNLSDYELKLIKSNSEIKEGSLNSFLMPESNVYIYYELKKKEVSSEKKERTRYFIPLPEAIKEMEDKQVKPVALVNLEDVKKHLQDDNKSYLFPLYNNYKVPSQEPFEIMVLYVGSVAYAILVYSEVTFKLFCRSDNSYLRNNLKYVDSLANVKDDIYSIILDSSFDSEKQFMDVLDHSYHYVLDVAFEKISAIEYKENVVVEEYNSTLLQIVPSLPKEFDPVFERAQAEAKKYMEYLELLKKIEDDLDKPIESEKTKIINEIEAKEEFISPISADEYMAPINITGEKYVEIKDITGIKQNSEEIQNLRSIIDDLSDICVKEPSRLQLENVIDFIVSRKEMANLTIDISQDMQKEPTTLKFLTSYFSLVYQGEAIFRIAMKHDKYVIRELLKVHPNIFRVRNGNEEDWYSLLIDETYESYEELYSIFLSSYNYTKSQYYKKNIASQENNLLK